MRRLTARGYALWDVVAESERKGSLDADIKNATFADVQALVARHPSIRRICFSSGGTTAKLFRRTHKAWLASLTLAPAPAPTLTLTLTIGACAACGVRPAVAQPGARAAAGGT